MLNARSFCIFSYAFASHKRSQQFRPVPTDRTSVIEPFVGGSLTPRGVSAYGPVEGQDASDCGHLQKKCCFLGGGGVDLDILGKKHVCTFFFLMPYVIGLQLLVFKKTYNGKM